jgi:uncharacterized Zn finger protein
MSSPVAVTHPRLAPRTRTARATTWWGRAWVRAVEEAAYAEEDLLAGRKLARAGRVGGIRVEPGRAWAAVEDTGGLWAADVVVPLLDEELRDALVETVAAAAGRITSLLAGDLPHELVEHAEEAGVELLPYGGELVASCTCEAWVDPCAHALALLQQLGWLLEADPFVLLHLRGLPREELLVRLHAHGPGTGSAGSSADTDAGADADPDLDAALDAAARAARFLERLEAGDGSVEHLL